MSNLNVNYFHLDLSMVICIVIYLDRFEGRNQALQALLRGAVLNSVRSVLHQLKYTQLK